MKLSELTVKDFIAELASDSPAPGGGSVAALMGSLGAALTSMVGNLTVGKEKYKDHWDAMAACKSESLQLAQRLLQLMEEDTDSFNAFMAALRLPKETDEEKARRSAAVQEATKGAVEVPLSTLRACAQMVQLAHEAAAKGNPNAITDAASAAQLARAGGIAASYNVRINLGGLKDQGYIAAVKKEIESLSAQIDSACSAVEALVEKALA